MAPNVLLVVSDDMGWNDVSFHGSEIQTPFLDSLALGANSVHLQNYYGQSICTPARSSILTGRYASHTGMQHSYWIQGEAGGLPLHFPTLANHFRAAGYSTHMVGKWHLGFESWDFSPLGRGFDSFFGYLGGGEDYLTHKSGGFVDLMSDKSAVLDAEGQYSTELFANRSIDVIHAHAHAAASESRPLFLYLAMQAIHSPLQAPAEWVEHYAWLTDTRRRTLAAMTSCLDAQLSRVVGALRMTGLWDNTVFAFSADNGGPPYVANSNWPMRGGKWTSWEGGTHLVGFVHAPTALPAPHKNFTGLMHQCDWVPTLLGAAGVTVLNDTASPPMDGLNLWPYLVDPADMNGTRTSVLLNVDPTNQGTAPHDPHGWSGYAGIRMGQFKLVLGDPGVPNSWCWPNQNGSVAALGQPVWPPAVHGPQLKGRVEGQPSHAECTVRQGSCFPGNDIASVAANSTSACCDACWAEPTCKAWTFHPDEAKCWIKRIEATPKLDAACVSGTMDARPPVPPPEPCAATEYSICTCAYNGTVPNNRMAPLLFDLDADPRETTNLAPSPTHADTLAALRAALQIYIDSAVTPLNMLPAERRADPRSNPTARNRTYWAPWSTSAVRDEL
jgi:arylsulfatase A-like enzyme